ncbi:MAG: membrane bound O-acyl transferase family-domain-containing protein [Candidatus Acidiferrales bacterium]
MIGASAQVESSHSAIAKIRKPPGRVWLGWIPVILLPLAVAAFRPALPPWILMWALAFAIFLASKWAMWWRQRRDGLAIGVAGTLAYFFLWPGMDPRPFAGAPSATARPSLWEWTQAIGNMLVGVALFWGVARRLVPRHDLFAGWVGMAGLVLMLHFGTFHISSLLWRCAGVNAEPIMRKPLRASSLSDFWGRRWNMEFRELSHGLVFEPVRKLAGIGTATFAAFLASGLIHDFVISFPARRGYGLPTAYFVIQGVGVLIERSGLGRALHVDRGVGARIFSFAFVLTPLPWLFHGTFVREVILPMMRHLHAI